MFRRQFGCWVSEIPWVPHPLCVTPCTGVSCVVAFIVVAVVSTVASQPEDPEATICPGHFYVEFVCSLCVRCQSVASPATDWQSVKGHPMVAGIDSSPPCNSAKYKRKRMDQ